MKYYHFEPDVPGCLLNGRHTLDNIDSVNRIKYQFDCWPDDDIVVDICVFAVKKKLATSLIAQSLTGFIIKECIVSKGDQFHIASPGCGDLPEFSWLFINGVVCVDDFGLSEDLNLVVSERALKLLKQFAIKNADITPL